MNVPHILSSFDGALDSLVAQILTMGADVVSALEKSGRAFREGDAEAAREVVQADLSIDAQYDKINADVLATLSRFQPVARDLRDVLAIEHTATYLERIADHAKSIPKRTIAASSSGTAALSSDILIKLQSLVETAVKDAVAAIETRDTALADKIRQGDNRIDDAYEDLFYSAIAQIKQDPELAGNIVHSLFAAKSLERIGDHATNIAEEVRFMTIGEAITATRHA